MKTETFSIAEVGSRYRDFVVQRSIPLPELQCHLVELEHEPSGARVMQIANDDNENLFSLSFRTLPETSNGVAHILEHTVLCGSKKFPLKDPFFSMIRRSLNTFMNAMTGSDFTCYPASSQVKADFYNLLDVYLDAVFHPHLHPLSFKQEGHRIEFSEPADPSSPLKYHGIVFNEMKGAMTTPESRLWEEFNKDLFPDLTYGYNSGGDPKVIPELTHEELLSFHEQYYHPSRCLFFFYGNLPLEGHLDFITDNALAGVKRLSPIPALPRQPRRSQPVRRTAFYPIPETEEADDKTLIALGWLTTSIGEQKELLALHLLDSILMDTDASPLKKALLRSEHCKQAMSYIDADDSETPFLLLLKGCKSGAADQLEALIRETLERIADEGIPEEAIEGAMHQLELQRSEISGDGYPFGLILYMRSALLRQHGVDPEKGLMVPSLFNELRQALEDREYLPSLIRKHFLNNQHMVRIEMQPDKQLAAKELQEEEERLAAIKAGLTTEQAEALVREAKELADFQEEQEEQDIDLLPKINMSDVPRECKRYALESSQEGNLKVHTHSTFTNHIAYVDLLFDLQPIKLEDLPLSRLFFSFLTQVGSGGRDYAATLEAVHAHTGGIAASAGLNAQASNPLEYQPTFQLRGKALRRKLGEFFPLFRDALQSADFTDVARLKELLTKQWSALQSSLASGAMRYASSGAAAALSPAGWMGYHWSGLGYYESIRGIVERFEKEPDWLVSELQRIQRQILTISNPELIVTADSDTIDEMRKENFYGLTGLIDEPSPKWQPDYELPKRENEGVVIAAPVAFTAKAVSTVPYTHPASAHLGIASFIADNKTLHRKIREQGGAYGGGSSAGLLSGIFSFHAYRDPNILSTLQAFDQSVEALAKGDFDEADLEEGQREMIQKLDNPSAPGSRGISAFCWLKEGRTNDIRQQLRDRLLSATKADIVKAVQEHLQPKMSEATVVTLTGRELLDKENQVMVEQGGQPLPVRELS